MFRLYSKVTAVLVASTLALSGCSTVDDEKVTLAVHDSFVMSNELIAQFKKDTGYEVEIVKLGDAGSLTNKLVLTQENPIADAFFGIDNTFAGVAESRGIVAGKMTKIDFADVCFNYDRDWFESRGVQPPLSWQSLTQKQYRGLTVVENPTTSSTGMAFLLATIAKLGESDWQTWWKQMKNNQLKVVAGWEDAYYTHFSGSAGKGNYPIVLSYSSSPADELNEDGSSRTASINRDCFRQEEFAGVLTNAHNPVGAQALVDFMLKKDFQQALPGSMYVYPVDESASIPENWAKFAPASKSFVDVTNLDIEANRNRWLDQWLDTQGLNK